MSSQESNPSEQKSQSSVDAGPVLPPPDPAMLVMSTPSEIDDRPAIRNWSSAPAFSVLGAFANFLFGTIMGLLFEIPFVAAIFCVILILYAVIMYRSYFSTRPIIKSSKAISFLNFFAGWIVFGWLWNRSLNKSHLSGEVKQGISYIVFTIIYGVLLVLDLVASVMYIVVPFDDPILQDAARPAISQREQNRVTDATTGASFILPNGWHSEDLSTARQYLRWKASPDDEAGIFITYGASENDGLDMDDYAEQDFVGTVAEVLNGCKDEKVVKRTFSGETYWVVSGSGTLTKSGKEVPVSMTMAFTVQNGIVHIYQLIDYMRGSAETRYYDGFELLLESATYKQPSLHRAS